MASFVPICRMAGRISVLEIVRAQGDRGRQVFLASAHRVRGLAIPGHGFPLVTVREPMQEGSNFPECARVRGEVERASLG
jgi:hypothetical protein